MTDKRQSNLESMIADDKKAIDIAIVAQTEVMTKEDDYTDLTDSQIIHLSILEAIQSQINSKFLGKFIPAFKRLRKSRNRLDRKEIVKMAEALRKEEEGIQTKVRDLLGVGM